MEALSVKLEAFDGPLDLLLHLIEKNKIDIFDIPIVEITEQYMEYVSAMETREMEVMSSFLVMAATLLRIKSRMLLPVEKNEEGEEEDPRDELVQRLLEYKMYKYASYELKDRQLDASHQLYKNATIPPEIAQYHEDVDIGELLHDVTLGKLQEIFRGVMRRQVDKIDPIRSKFGNIQKENISVEDRMLHIEEYAMLHRKFSFRALLEEQPSKLMTIVTFLGILEFMKVGRLQISQEETFGEILIEYVSGSEKTEIVTSSAD